MRRHFLGKFVVILGVAVAAIVGLSALVGGFFFRGEGDRGPFFPIGLVGVVLVVLLVVRAGRRFASPVVDVMEAADRVAGGDYEARVEVRGPREVQRLGAAFNAMTERLGSNEDRRRQLLADVAHELRTPLSVIQANLEAGTARSPLRNGLPSICRMSVNVIRMTSSITGIVQRIRLITKVVTA